MSARQKAISQALQTARKVGPALRTTPVLGGGTTVKAHVGPIHSAVAGRTDHLPMHVPSRSYVLPADIVSGMGEGNTNAGFKVAKSMFSVPDRTAGTPYGQTGLPYGAVTPHATGGSVGEYDNEPPVPIVAAGGEYVLSPHEVAHQGQGSIDDGHEILDEFVKQYRSHLVKTLRNLPGPKRD